jgi:hypothetical protein
MGLSTAEKSVVPNPARMLQELLERLSQHTSAAVASKNFLRGERMTSKLMWTLACLALIAVAVSTAPDLRRYYKISTM